MNFIELGGKRRPIRFSHRALVRLSDHLDAKSFQDLGEKVMEMGVKDLPFLTHLGLLEGARKMKEEFDASVENVEEWLDDESAAIFQTVLEAFGADFAGGTEEKKPAAKGRTK